jgi:hypothetical protein
VTLEITCGPSFVDRRVEKKLMIVSIYTPNLIGLDVFAHFPQEVMPSRVPSPGKMLASFFEDFFFRVGK